MEVVSAWWLLGGVGVAAVFALTSSCGSEQPRSGFDPDPPTPTSSDAAADGPSPSLPESDAGVVVRDDFAAPILTMGAPADAAQIFGAADTAAGGPCLFEPELGSLFPNNWIRPRFRFSVAQSENLFEIKLTIPNEKSPLVIYTTNSGYALDKTAWNIITNFGVGTVHVTVRSAVISAGGQLTGGPWKGSEGDIEIAPIAATGSVAYWTTSGGTVLKGFKIGDESVQTVITPAQSQTQCVACHTSTPDGLYVGLSASDDLNDGSGPGYVGLRSVDGKATEPPFLTASAKSLLARKNQHAPTFSRTHWSAGDRVSLTMFDVNGKTEIVWTDLEAAAQTQGTGWDILQRNGDPNAASSASFSHDGKSVAYVSATGIGAGVIEDQGQLWTVPYNNRQGGAATPVPGASEPTYLQYYPTFSADDQLLAFNRIPTGQTSYNAPAAEVFVIPAAGGAATRLLANDPPACLTAAKSPGITNSWPKWSPEVVQKSGSSYYFLVFSSTRNAATGGPQLYVAPIVITGGNVKTYAALYLWNQPEVEHNHTPAWDAFQLPPVN